MSDLVVLAFDTENGAASKTPDIDRMQKMQILSLEDAAIVIRDKDGKAKVKQSTNLVGMGAWGGAFWGVLIGMLFWAPWLGMAVGAMYGALMGKFKDIGIDDSFIKSIGDTITPGTSALFLMVRDHTPDRVIEEVRGWKGVTLLHTSLSREAEDHLREAFATELRDEAAT